MAADSLGNDLGAVDVPVTGFAAVNFNATSMPTEAQLKAKTLPTGYSYLGLFTQDGGYAEETEAGESTEFFQQGYSRMTGEESITGTLTLAENNETVRKLLGYEGAQRKYTAYKDKFGLIIATYHDNGVYEARGGLAEVTEVSPSQETRGEIDTYEVTFKWTHCSGGGFYTFATDTVTAFPSPCDTTTAKTTSK